LFIYKGTFVVEQNTACINELASTAIQQDIDL